jgi:hypothetical protein
VLNASKPARRRSPIFMTYGFQVYLLSKRKIAFEKWVEKWRATRTGYLFMLVLINRDFSTIIQRNKIR